MLKPAGIIATLSGVFALLPGPATGHCAGYDWAAGRSRDGQDQDGGNRRKAVANQAAAARLPYLSCRLSPMKERTGAALSGLLKKQHRGCMATPRQPQAARGTAGPGEAAVRCGRPGEKMSPAHPGHSRRHRQESRCFLGCAEAVAPGASARTSGMRCTLWRSDDFPPIV